MKRFKDAPTNERCQAVVTLADGTTADCGRRCTQHAKMEIARLRAVNTDLLAVCKRIVSNAVECEMHGEPSQVDGIDWVDILALRDAIADAKGGGA